MLVIRGEFCLTGKASTGPGLGMNDDFALSLSRNLIADIKTMITTGSNAGLLSCWNGLPEVYGSLPSNWTVSDFTPTTEARFTANNMEGFSLKKPISQYDHPNSLQVNFGLMRPNGTASSLGISHWGQLFLMYGERAEWTGDIVTKRTDMLQNSISLAQAAIHSIYIMISESGILFHMRGLDDWLTMRHDPVEEWSGNLTMLAFEYDATETNAFYGLKDSGRIFPVTFSKGYRNNRGQGCGLRFTSEEVSLDYGSSGMVAVESFSPMDGSRINIDVPLADFPAGYYNNTLFNVCGLGYGNVEPLRLKDIVSNGGTEAALGFSPDPNGRFTIQYGRLWVGGVFDMHMSGYGPENGKYSAMWGKALPTLNLYLMGFASPYKNYLNSQLLFTNLEDSGWDFGVLNLGCHMFLVPISPVGVIQ